MIFCFNCESARKNILPGRCVDCIGQHVQDHVGILVKHQLSRVLNLDQPGVVCSGDVSSNVINRGHLVMDAMNDKHRTLDIARLLRPVAGL